MLLYFIPHVFYLQPAPELLTTSATMAKTAMINNVFVVKYQNMKEIETLKKKKKNPYTIFFKLAIPINKMQLKT